MRDVFPLDGPYHANLLCAREAVPRLLDVFARHDVAATVATVGLLFEDGREEALAFAPTLRPSYDDAGLDPYPVLHGHRATEPVGDSEREDALHFAPLLVRAILDALRQELASHTYSHFAALERGATVETFEADLAAAQEIARAHYSAPLRSLVQPCHQFRTDFLPALARTGFVAHRGPEPNAIGRRYTGTHDALWKRAARLADAYVSPTGVNAERWPRPNAMGLVDVPESRFLRSFVKSLSLLEPVRVRRAVGAMAAAARIGAMRHVWWHPHNFGTDLEANLANLEAVLEVFDHLRDSHGFAPLSIAGVADRVVADTAPTC